MRGTESFDKRKIEYFSQLAADRACPGNSVEPFEGAIPPDDAFVHIEHHQAVVQGLENVLVELAHTPELFGFEVQLPIETAVFDRGRDLARH